MIKLRKIVFLILFFAVLSPICKAQTGTRETKLVERVNKDNDTTYYMRIPNALITGTRKPRVTGNDARLGLAVYVTYGIAKEARREFEALNVQLEQEKSSRKRRDMINAKEEELIAKYTPVLNQISIYQGKVLLKLMYKELGDSSFDVVKELKGGFSANFWQGIAKIFGTNLKTGLTDSHDDQLILFYSDLYEQGVLYQYLRARTTIFDAQQKKKK